MVQKLWRLCDILRDDGITYHQYINELTYLLFLKMAEESGTESLLPKGNRWSDLHGRQIQDRFSFYHQLLLDLGKAKSRIIRAVYAHPTSLIRHPENLDALVEGIESLDWHSMDQEALGDIYEGLLEKTAGESLRGAGQYFTPRPLVEAIISVVRPSLIETIQDPAAGTGGFLIVADRFRRTLSKKRSRRKVGKAFGVELNPDTHRLLSMNVHLHGIDGEFQLGDSLARLGERIPPADLIVTNPPFGTGRGGRQPRRNDLPFPTANKQLAFLQHIYLNLKPGGRAAVVVPDNVLFEEGTGLDVRTDLVHKCNLHTILRLPCGLFYAAGVKTNVLFFAKDGATKETWIYDARTNVPPFGRTTNRLSSAFFEEFVLCYGEDVNGRSRRTVRSSPTKSGFLGGGRWRKFTIAEVRKRNFKLDSLKWLRDEALEDSAELPEPVELATDAISELNTAVNELNEIVVMLEHGKGAEVST